MSDHRTPTTLRQPRSLPPVNRLHPSQHHQSPPPQWMLNLSVWSPSTTNSIHTRRRLSSLVSWPFRFHKDWFWYCAIDNASSEDPRELSFKKGETIDILTKSDQWWEARKATGQKGSGYHRLCIPIIDVDALFKLFRRTTWRLKLAFLLCSWDDAWAPWIGLRALTLRRAPKLTLTKHGLCIPVSVYWHTDIVNLTNGTNRYSIARVPKWAVIQKRGNPRNSEKGRGLVGSEEGGREQGWYVIFPFSYMLPIYSPITF